MGTLAVTARQVMMPTVGLRCSGPMLRVSIENPLLCRFKLDNVISYSIFIVTFVITLPKVS